MGAFYARFGDKSGLLSALYERYDQGLDTRISAWLAKQPHLMVSKDPLYLQVQIQIMSALIGMLLYNRMIEL